MQCVVFANGKLEKNPETKKILANTDLIIAADGGANHCAALDILPQVVIGDCDSIDSELLRNYIRRGVAIHRFPEKKDATDLELAINYAREKKVDSLHVFGALGGRWDMSLANIMLLANSKHKRMHITLSGDNAMMYLLHPGKRILSGAPGTRVSLLPVRKDARGVSLSGFEYPLTRHTIKFGSTIGISNVLVETTAVIQHQEGVLLCIFQQETVERS